jgi:hypothetical protein
MTSAFRFEEVITEIPLIFSGALTAGLLAIISPIIFLISFNCHLICKIVYAAFLIISDTAGGVGRKAAKSYCISAMSFSQLQ